MSTMNVDQILAQMRTLSIEAQNKPAAPVGSKDNGDFAALLKQSIDSVNEMQQSAGKLSHEFEVGDANVSLAEVMIASQKADVSFQAMLQVRNKLVDAYKDVMNMPM